jgi:protein TonB
MNTKTFTAPALALLVNIFLFAILPLFAQRGFYKQDLETIIPVNILQHKRPSSPQPEEKKKEPPEQEKTEKVIPTIKLSAQKSISPQRLEVEIPKLTFEINPKLAVGIPVSPPPSESVVFSPKDSYHQGEVDQVPMPIFKTKPFYPYRARRLNVSGEVEVKFLVDEKGNVSKAQILKSGPEGIFDESVLKAIPSWRFSPGKVGGHAVSTWVVMTIEFKMEG